MNAKKSAPGGEGAHHVEPTAAIVPQARIDDERFLAEWRREVHEPKPGIPDGMRCINCRVPARDGRIVHTRGCPDYRRPVRRSGVTSDRGRVDPQDAYLRFTAALTPGRRRDRYVCPSCGGDAAGRGLKVEQVGDRVRFHCFSCAGRAEILAAVGLTWADLGWSA